jgi:hypothetical protein
MVRGLDGKSLFKGIDILDLMRRHCVQQSCYLPFDYKLGIIPAVMQGLVPSVIHRRSVPLPVPHHLCAYPVIGFICAWYNKKIPNF